MSCHPLSCGLSLTFTFKKWQCMEVTTLDGKYKVSALGSIPALRYGNEASYVLCLADW